jgi:hypothetical protein
MLSVPRSYPLTGYARNQSRRIYAQTLPWWRGQASLGSLNAMAQVLNVSVSSLLEESPGTIGAADIPHSREPIPVKGADRKVAENASVRQEVSPAIARLCDALTDYGSNPGQFGSARSVEIPSLGNLERVLTVTFNAYQQSRFTRAANRIPVLLAHAQLAVRECRPAEHGRALRLLALSYQAAAAVLTKTGDSDLALLASERGLNAAEVAGDPSVRGSLIRSTAFSLLSTGRLEPAMRLAESGATTLQGEIVRDGGNRLSS